MTENAPRVTAQGFIDNIVLSGLLDREELARAMEDMPPTNRARIVARHLVEKGRLTKFQAEKLLSGRTDGFILGQYRVLEELGRGGMGRVYKAVHQTMGRYVAIKLLAPDLTKTDRAKELFNREVKAAAKLNHPNIVISYDANQSGDRFFLVMEFVDGPNLSQLVKDQGPLPIEQACEYIRQAAIGLEYAHEMGVIHRDVKPSNLLVQQSTSGPQVKILDFGLALVTAGQGSSGENVVGTTNTALGTPDYVSPEQARNQYNVDGRSDLYSLGCTFYYLLTGETPFPGGTALEKMIRHGGEAPVAVQSKRTDVPDDIAAIVHKLLAKNPKWRHQKASELAAELAAAVGKKADWSAPPRPAAKKKQELTTATPLSSSDEPFESIDLDEHSASTLPTAVQSTGEAETTRMPHPRPLRKRRKSIPWPWIIVGAIMAFAVVAGVTVAVKYLMNNPPQHVSEHFDRD